MKYGNQLAQIETLFCPRSKGKKALMFGLIWLDMLEQKIQIELEIPPCRVSEIAR
jgi:hypothetical protein